MTTTGRFEAAMIADLLTRIFCRAALPVCITVSMTAPMRAADGDVFQLLTGEQSTAPVTAHETLPAASESDYILLSDVEEVAPGAAKPFGEMSLSRPIDTLTVSPTTPEFNASMASIPEQFRIQNEAERKFGSWSVPHLSIATLSSGYIPSEFYWAAPAVYHRPLYFEQPNVERYGHYVSVCKGGNCLQSAVCAAHFFATVPVLPYKIGADPCGECQYVLGTYRPGSCNPHQLVRPEASCCGLALQGVTVTGLVFLIP